MALLPVGKPGASVYEAVFMGFRKIRELEDAEVFACLESPVGFGLMLGELVQTARALMRVEYAPDASWRRTAEERNYRVFPLTLTKENLWQIYAGGEWLNLYVAGNAHEVIGLPDRPTVVAAHIHALEATHGILSRHFKGAFRVVLYGSCEAFVLEHERIVRTTMWTKTTAVERVAALNSATTNRSFELEPLHD